MSQEEFDALMPHEFWREVVDRVAAEVPGTLLLAEAFWLLEGYFVRTLGMHRVYNSAFMNMLRDEENAKYRSYLKKTLEFDPDILKRYVNFMSNPDERTAIDQFGTGDKYFGVCTLLATLPGLPMFGHGQIEGFTERYGMEFKRARMDEHPNEGLVARHQREIAPLLKNRHALRRKRQLHPLRFLERARRRRRKRLRLLQPPGRRALAHRLQQHVRHHPRHHPHLRRLHGQGQRQAAPEEPRRRSRDPFRRLGHLSPTAIRRGLEYLRRATDIHHHGLRLICVASNTSSCWTGASSAPPPISRGTALCDSLHGEGVHSVDEALAKLRLRPLHEAFHQAINKECLLICGAIGKICQAVRPKNWQRTPRRNHLSQDPPPASGVARGRNRKTSFRGFPKGIHHSRTRSKIAQFP